VMVSQEMLRTVCQPFIDQMLEALQGALQTQLHGVSDPCARTGGMSGQSPFEMRGSLDPFGSVFDSVPQNPLRASRFAMRESEPTQQPVRSCSTPSSSVRASGTPLPAASSVEPHTETLRTAGGSSSDASLPQKVTYATGCSSKSSSPAMQGREPIWQAAMAAKGGFTEPSGDVSVCDPSVAESSVPSSTQSAQPMYLDSSNRWADQRLTPNVSPLMPISQPTRPASVGDNAIDTDYVFIADEKSPMVCRHWKSKGWCKLEGKCKFLHPEHKRGTGPSPSAQRHANGTGVQRCISTGVSPTESTPSTASQQRGSKVSRCKSSGGGSHLIQTRGFQCGN